MTFDVRTQHRFDLPESITTQAQQRATRISEFPFEVLSRIFLYITSIELLSSTFNHSSRNAVRDLLSITHTCWSFRDVALSSPKLWTTIPPLNHIQEDLLCLMLERSCPLPFCIAFKEDDTLPLGDLMWEPVFSCIERMGSLRIEIGPTYGGYMAKFLLSMPVESLEHCVVAFLGEESVRLDLDEPSYQHPFANNAPKLRSLSLTNCYIPLVHCNFPNLSSLAIHYTLPFLPSSSDQFIRFSGFHGHQLRLLRRLVIWDCMSQLDPNDRLELSSLQELVVAAPYATCESFANVLLYPSQCSANVTVLFPPNISPDLAKTAVVGAASFIRPGEPFTSCRLVLIEDDTPSIRLVRPCNRGDIVLRFKLHGVEVFLKPIHKLLMDGINVLSLVSPPPVTPFDLFSFLLWDTLADRLQPHLTALIKLHAIFPSQQSSANPVIPRYPLAVLAAMPHVRFVSFEPVAVYTNGGFFNAALGLFPGLRRIIFKLCAELSSEERVAISDFLKQRSDCGRPIAEAVFALSAGLVHSMGYASPDAIRLMLADYSQTFPPSLTLDYVEK